MLNIIKIQHVQQQYKLYPNEYVQHVNNYICSAYYINSLVYWDNILTKELFYRIGYAISRVMLTEMGTL